ncbi:MAG: DUF1800 domain-containing protein [Candidatus Thiodiazotropha taylori]
MSRRKSLSNSHLDDMITAAPIEKLHNRREFLSLMANGLGYSALAFTLPGCGSSEEEDDEQSENDPVTVETEIPQASAAYSVLKRTSFGVHRDQLESINNLGIDQYLEQQLDYINIDDANLESEIQTRFPLIFESPNELYAGFPENIETIVRQMIGATQYRQIFSRRQLYEVMVEFWTDHFNIHLINGLEPTLKPTDDQQVIRTHALGNFRDLLHASAKSPAMLFYLDNYNNLASAPNENYARELMELHTLGVDGGYTETDIKEVARCFTGWTIEFPNSGTAEYGVFRYNDAIHDQQSKVVLNQTIAAGGGQQDGEQILDLLATHPSTADFIAIKLCRRFVSDDPDQAIIDQVAEAFSNSQGDIKQTLRALFTSNAMQANADQKLTRPSEFLAGLVRALVPDTGYPADHGELYFFAQAILGQLPYFWSTPDGYPDVQSYWSSTGGILNRWRLSFFSFAPISLSNDIIFIDYLPMLNGAESLAAITDALTDAILMRPISSADRRHIIDWLTAEYRYDEDATLPDGIPEQIAPLVAAVLVSSVYFQLR